MSAISCEFTFYEIYIRKNILRSLLYAEINDY